MIDFHRLNTNFYQTKSVLVKCVTFSEKQEDDDVISWGIRPRTAKSWDYIYHRLGLKVKFVYAYKVPILLDEENPSLEGKKN